MRVAGVLLRRDARRRFRDQAFIGEPAHHLLLDVELRGRHAVAQAAGDGFESAILDPVERRRCLAMGGDRGVVPGCVELLDEVSRRHDLGAQAAHQLDGAGIHARDVGNGAVGRVLHRHAGNALQ